MSKNVEIKYWVILLFFTPAAIIAAWAMALSIAPSSYWFRYDAIRPEKQAFQIGEPLQMVSERSIRHRHNIGFVDTLYCDIDGDDLGYGYISEQSATIPQVEPHSLGTRPWRYGAPGPGKPASCVIRSTQFVEHGFGIRSYAPEIRTEPFRIE
ncbi:MAG: hypothetical protein AAF511_08470 [Pseudomonadota bacterium]